jgi:DNA-binding MarR family transcriptional regulator
MARPVIAKATPPLDEVIALGQVGDSIGFRLRRIQNHLVRAYTERVSAISVRSGVMTALSIIGANPGISQTDLARGAGFDKASVVGLIDELETLGWAKRVRPPTDRRRHALTLTPSGEVAVKQLAQAAKEVESALTDHIAPKDMALLITLLDSVFARCLADDAS